MLHAQQGAAKSRVPLQMAGDRGASEDQGGKKHTRHSPICNNILILFIIEMVLLRSAVLQTVNTGR